MGCSQVVRQRFLVACTVGSNPTIPAIIHECMHCENIKRLTLRKEQITLL